MQDHINRKNPLKYCGDGCWRITNGRNKFIEVSIDTMCTLADRVFEPIIQDDFGWALNISSYPFTMICKEIARKILATNRRKISKMRKSGDPMKMTLMGNWSVVIAQKHVSKRGQFTHEVRDFSTVIEGVIWKYNNGLEKCIGFDSDMKTIHRDLPITASAKTVIESVIKTVEEDS